MPDADRPRETPLSRSLRRPGRRAEPRDVFELAQKKWMEGERIEIGALAKELGVGRATVFRWIGSRELLLGEVIWSVLSATQQHVLATAEGKGADLAADMSYRLMDLLLESEPLRQFIAQDAEYALKLLTSKDSAVQTRAVQFVSKLLRETAEADGRGFAIEMDALAFIIVRIVESCIYSDQITGRKPDIRTASDAIRILVSARVDHSPSKKRKRTRRQAS
jgi:hypothetical protein